MSKVGGWHKLTEEMAPNGDSYNYGHWYFFNSSDGKLTGDKFIADDQEHSLSLPECYVLPGARIPTAGRKKSGYFAPESPEITSFWLLEFADNIRAKYGNSDGYVLPSVEEPKVLRSVKLDLGPLDRYAPDIMQYHSIVKAMDDMTASIQRTLQAWPIGKELKFELNPKTDELTVTWVESK